MAKAGTTAPAHCTGRGFRVPPHKPAGTRRRPPVGVSTRATAPARATARLGPSVGRSGRASGAGCRVAVSCRSPAPPGRASRGFRPGARTRRTASGVPPGYGLKKTEQQETCQVRPMAAESRAGGRSGWLGGRRETGLANQLSVRVHRSQPWPARYRKVAAAYGPNMIVGPGVPVRLRKRRIGRR